MGLLLEARAVLTYPLGESALIEVTFRNRAGKRYDPPSVRIEWVDPTQQEDYRELSFHSNGECSWWIANPIQQPHNAAMTRHKRGKYSYEIPVTAAGKYDYTIVAPGNGVCGVFAVVEQPALSGLLEVIEA